MLMSTLSEKQQQIKYLLIVLCVQGGRFRMQLVYCEILLQLGGDIKCIR
jgi:hypothetical protein